MNILMVGVPNSTSGAWKIRGEQLGAALGARVTTQPTMDDWHWADLAILVKRAWTVWATHAHHAKVPIVWDALDCWRQPAENHLSEAQAKALFKRQISQIRPALVVCATEAQAAACGGVYLPHHSREGLSPTPARDVVSTVCYEGNPAYLGQWGQAIKRECAKRGWSFVLNPPDLRMADIVVAFRDGQWDGWMCRNWKSGVKIVNAMSAGRPIIAQPSAAMHELGPESFYSTVDEVSDLPKAFDIWSDAYRRSVVARIKQHNLEHVGFRYSLAAVADRYRQILQTVGQTCAA